MRRAAVAVVASMLGLMQLAPAGADQGRRVLEASSRASIVFSTLDVQPQFDPAVIDSRSASSGIGTSSLDSVEWPSFLVDAFFFLYGFQSVERVGLGIAEARWPAGPVKADATQSDLLFSNVGSAPTTPVKGGRSFARASEGKASGDAAASAIKLVGGEIEGASSTSQVTTIRNVSTASAKQTVSGATFGPLRIDLVEGSVSVSAGDTRRSTEELIVAGVHVGGIEAKIDRSGVKAVMSPLQDAVDRALAGSGISAKILPGTTDRRDAAHASSGGVLVSVHQERTDPTGTPRNVTISYLLGAASATARATQLSAPLPTLPPAPTVNTAPAPATSVGSPPAGTGSLAGPAVIRRIIMTRSVVPGAGARGAYAALVLVGLGLVLIRPFLRAASRE
jgi:hypothetical protein